MSNIKFNRTTSFLGRNGVFKAIGLDFYQGGEESIYISPITSKKAIGRCYVQIPKENILDLIKELENLK